MKNIVYTEIKKEKEKKNKHKLKCMNKLLFCKTIFKKILYIYNILKLLNKIYRYNYINKMERFIK